jgi:hypothetical protein
MDQATLLSRSLSGLGGLKTGLSARGSQTALRQGEIPWRGEPTGEIPHIRTQ